MYDTSKERARTSHQCLNGWINALNWNNNNNKITNSRVFGNIIITSYSWKYTTFSIFVNHLQFSTEFQSVQISFGIFQFGKNRLFYLFGWLILLRFVFWSQEKNVYIHNRPDFVDNMTQNTVVLTEKFLDYFGKWFCHMMVWYGAAPSKHSCKFDD